jgi:hypothetical protein
LTVPKRKGRKSKALKVWLDEAAELMREVLKKSNLYTSLPLCYTDLLAFGTHCVLCLEDDKDVVRFYTIPIGSYCLGTDSAGRVDTIARKMSMTAKQMEQEFGRESLSSAVITALEEKRNTEQWFEVTHVIMPNECHCKGVVEAMAKPWASYWYEEGQKDDQGTLKQFLRISGYDEFPGMCPRWDVTGEDVYGYSPGMEALPKVRALQIQCKRLAQVRELNVRPPLVGPSSLAGQRASLVPGDITYCDGPSQGGLRPIFEVQDKTQTAMEEVRESQKEIRNILYQDIFLALQQMDRSNVTATEIQAIENEKMMQLGPVSERMDDELRDPLIDRVFGIMMRRGMFSPPPPELQGEDLTVEYSSIIAQAQKMLGITAVDRFLGATGNLSAVKPQVMDNIDEDEVTQAYAEMLGVPPSMIHSREEVNAIRTARAQQIQQQQALEASTIQAKNAEVLSRTDTQRPSALTALAEASRSM